MESSKRSTADFSLAIMEAGKRWDSILESAQRKRLVAKKFLSSKTSLNNRGEVSKDAIRECSAIRPGLQKVPKGVLQVDSNSEPHEDVKSTGKNNYII